MQFLGLSRFFHGMAISSQWGGVSQINSGDASKVVSATNVQSGGPILVTGIGSGGPSFPLRVDSIVDGVSFLVMPASGSVTAPQPFSWIAFRR